MEILLYIFKIHLKIVYIIIKLIFRQKDEVFFLSRQFSDVSLNYQRIMDKLDENNIKYKCICKKVDTSINDSIRTQGNYSNSKSFLKRLISNIKSALSYYFNLYLQMKYLAQSKVVIIDGYNLSVSVLKHKKGTKVIQLWHALGAIKKFGYQSVGYKDGINPKVAKILNMHANYDYVISGSDGMNKYFSEAFNTPMDKMLSIGTPTIDYMLEDNSKEKKKIYKKYPQLKEKINVLYSPTFRNDKRTQTDEIIKNFDFSKCNLLLAFHPKIEMKKYDDRVICVDAKDFSIYDIVKTVDYVITDYSALMIDAAICSKKILLYVYDYEKYDLENGLNIELLKEFPHLSYKDAKPLMNVIVKNKYDEQEYKNFRDKYVTNRDGNSATKLLELIRRCLNEKN